MKNYDDIIGLPHWEPSHHTRMSLANRAAQFAPFAALSGHDEALRETARLTDVRTDLDGEALRMLNTKMMVLIEHLSGRPQVQLTYFIPDPTKDGGSYATYRGRVRKVDDCAGVIIFTDTTEIPIRSITDITGKIFKDIETKE